MGDVTTGRAKGKATNKNQGGVLEVSDAREGDWECGLSVVGGEGAGRGQAARLQA